MIKARYRPKLKAKCPNCESRDVNRHGTRVSRRRGKLQSIICKDCGYVWERPLAE